LPTNPAGYLQDNSKGAILVPAVMKPFSEHISIDPSIRFGKPCIRGTRIAVADILTWLASGMSIGDILQDYPELSEESIRAALAFAAHREQSGRIVLT
jgi:uncharacterized protein (DUF433 family)